MTSYRRLARGDLLAICMLLCATLLGAAFGANAAVASARPPHPNANARQLARCRAFHTHRARCRSTQRALARAGRRLARAKAKLSRTVNATEIAATGAQASGPFGSISDPAPAGGREPPSPQEAPSSPREASPPPQEVPLQSQVTFQPGINSGSAAIWELPGATLLGAKVVRVGVPIEETASELEPVVAAYAAKGVRIVALACFEGTLPTPAQAHNLATWASTFGPGGSFWSNHPGGQYALQAIEFGNETSFSWQYSNNTPAGYASRAQTYALRAAEAAAAIRAANPGVGLLVQADSGNAGSIWVESMFKAVPDLGSLVAGWTVHPYGTRWREKLEELLSQTTVAGAPATIPIDVTEWGLSTDNGTCVNENYGWNPCMSYQEAAEVLSRTISEMRAALHGRLGLLLLYKIRDQKPAGATSDREDYFGAVQSELQPKGAYTAAVESFLASS